jgi:hypothetical protein
VYVVPNNKYHTLTHLLLLPKYIAYNFWPKLNLIILNKYIAKNIDIYYSLRSEISVVDLV